MACQAGEVSQRAGLPTAKRKSLYLVEPGGAIGANRCRSIFPLFSMAATVMAQTAIPATNAAQRTLWEIVASNTAIRPVPSKMAISLELAQH